MRILILYVDVADFAATKVAAQKREVLQSHRVTTAHARRRLYLLQRGGVLPLPAERRGSITLLVLRTQKTAPEAKHYSSRYQDTADGRLFGEKQGVPLLVNRVMIALAHGKEEF
ncbi:MAG: hypothetical protein LBU24_01600 [Methanocalculaceae archaeon]|jgi:hypothetical protein|nr:hypothetical protein [Methanocalculaceae archaeon]